MYSSPRSSSCAGAGARRRHAPTRRRTTRPWHASCTPCKEVKEVKNFYWLCRGCHRRDRAGLRSPPVINVVQAQPAHFRFSPDSGQIATSHRSATKSADARRGAAHGGELRQAAGAAETVEPRVPAVPDGFQTVRCASSLLETRCLQYCSVTHRIAGRVRQRSISAARASGRVGDKPTFPLVWRSPQAG